MPTPLDKLCIADNGGPAFPIVDGQRVHDIASAAIVGITDPAERDKVYIEARASVASGMSLRDYFAAKAMTAFLTAFPTDWSLAETALASYGQADAMLAERAK